MGGLIWKVFDMVAWKDMYVLLVVMSRIDGSVSLENGSSRDKSTVVYYRVLQLLIGVRDGHLRAVLLGYPLPAL